MSLPNPAGSASGNLAKIRVPNCRGGHFPEVGEGLPVVWVFLWEDELAIGRKRLQ
jgi:hypothetical protein